MADDSNITTLTAQHMASEVSRNGLANTLKERAGKALNAELWSRGWDVAKRGDTTCEITITSELVSEVARQANHLGFGVTVWHRGRKETPTGRLTLRWPDQPWTSPAQKIPPPPHPVRYRSEPGQSVWDWLRQFVSP